jgi:hypothetical protein
VTASPRPPSLWDQATSTRGGRWAVAVAILAVCLLVGTAAVAMAASARQDRTAVTNAAADTGKDPGQGKGQAKGQGKGQDKDKDKDKAADPQGKANGNGDLSSIPGRLGGTLHGEVTRPGAAGGVETLLVQSGEVTAASGTEVTVKSTDGFSETYALANTTTVRGPAKAAGLTAGTHVTVVAAKDGKKALLVASTGRPS